MSGKFCDFCAFNMDNVHFSFRSSQFKIRDCGVMWWAASASAARMNVLLRIIYPCDIMCTQFVIYIIWSNEVNERANERTSRNNVTTKGMTIFIVDADAKRWNFRSQADSVSFFLSQNWVALMRLQHKYARYGSVRSVYFTFKPKWIGASRYIRSASRTVKCLFFVVICGSLDFTHFWRFQ